MSDQREYQLAHEAAGLCTQCSNDAYLGGKLCLNCRERQRRRMRSVSRHAKRKPSHRWCPGRPGRPPLEYINSKASLPGGSTANGVVGYNGDLKQK